MSTRCDADARWLLRETVGAWLNATSEAGRSQQRLLAPLVQAAVCTPEARGSGHGGGAAGMVALLEDESVIGKLGLSDVLQLLMTEPLVRPPQNLPFASSYKLKLAYYEQAVRTLLAKASRRISATPQLERAANRTRVSSTPEKLRAGLNPPAYLHDIECIATLLTPAPPPSAPQSVFPGLGTRPSTAAASAAHRPRASPLSPRTGSKGGVRSARPKALID